MDERGELEHSIEPTDESLQVIAPAQPKEATESTTQSFLKIVSADLDSNITTEQIQARMLEHNFPAAIAELLGNDLKALIAETRTAMMTAKTIPAAKEAIEKAAVDKVTEYFERNRERIALLLEASKSPAEYLETLRAIFATKNLDELSEKELRLAKKSLDGLNQIGGEKLLETISGKIAIIVEQELGFKQQSITSRKPPMVEYGSTSFYLNYHGVLGKPNEDGQRIEQVIRNRFPELNIDFGDRDNPYCLIVKLS